VLERWWRRRGAGGGFSTVMGLEQRIVIVVVVGRGSHPVGISAVESVLWKASTVMRIRKRILG
jgi:hypothetical protein